MPPPATWRRVKRMPTSQGSWTPAYWLSAGLTVVLLVVAASGLVLPGMYRDPAASWTAQARGVNLVDVVVTVPTLVASIALSTRGSWRARIVWPPTGAGRRLLLEFAALLGPSVAYAHGLPADIWSLNLDGSNL